MAMHYPVHKSTDYKMKRPTILLFLQLFFFAANPLTAEETVPSGDYQLGPGDKLVISVFNQEDLTGEYAINGAGRISMPFIGNVDAKGLTITELTDLIVNKLKPDYLLNPRVSIEVLNFRPFYIIGEVNAPNSYPYVEGMTYLNAVAIAGGYTYRAKKGYAMVRRNEDQDGKEQKVDMTSSVMPGDIIRIVERMF
jgi:protein involved in polysaccharide export with SLBB domain